MNETIRLATQTIRASCDTIDTANGAPAPGPSPTPPPTPTPTPTPGSPWIYRNAGPLKPFEAIKLTEAPAAVVYWRLRYRLTIGALNETPLAPGVPARYKLGYDRTSGAWIYDSEIQVAKGVIVWITDLDGRVKHYDPQESLSGKTLDVELEKLDGALVVKVNGAFVGTAPAQVSRTGLVHELTFGASPKDVSKHRSWPSDPVQVSNVELEMR